MNTDYETRFAKLESDVEQLKRLATLDQQIEEARAKVAPEPRRMGFLSKFLIFLVLVIGAGLLALPFINSALTTTFTSLGTNLSNGN